MLLDFERIRSFIPTPELRELLEKEIAALGDACPRVDLQRATVAMALAQVARVQPECPVYVPLPPSDPHPLAPWVVAYGARHASEKDYGHFEARRQVDALSRFEARAVEPLLGLAGSASLRLRALAFAAIAEVLARCPDCLDAAVLAALARGVADPSAKVRSAAYEALSRHPERAQRALADAAETAKGKALALTREALARLGAPAEEADAPTAPDPEDAQLLAGLVSVWAATRAPGVADLIDTLSSRMPAPPLAGRSKTEKEGEWHVLAKRRDPATLASLLAASWPVQWRDAQERLAALKGWPDPRIAVALVRLLEAQPYRSQASLALYRNVLGALHVLRDARQLEPLKRAGAALLAHFRGFDYLGDFKQGAEGRALEEALRLAPPLEPPDDDPFVSRARSRLAGVREGAAERARTETGFLERIWADPDSEELRRVYADWLLEHGDVRGEFISLQCERAAGRGTPASERREKQLLAEHEERLAGPLAAYTLRNQRGFERGFVSAAVVETSRLALGLEEPAWATVRSLSVAEWSDAAVLAKFFAGAGRRVVALHGVRSELALEVGAQCPECPLEDVSLWMYEATPLELKLPKLRRLGVLRHRYALGRPDRTVDWAGVVGEKLWSNLEDFTINDVPSEYLGWFSRFRDRPWLRSLHVLSPESFSVVAPQGWEVRFERDSAGAPVRLVVEAHAGVAQVTPLARGLARLPSELRGALVVVETRSLGSMDRASLEALRSA